MTKKQPVKAYFEVLTKEQILARQKALREVIQIGKLVEALEKEQNMSDIIAETAAIGIYENCASAHREKIQAIKNIKYNSSFTQAYLQNSAGDTIARVNLETFCCELA